jgi:hypothetical protein
MSGVQRLFLLVLATNMILLLLGPFVAPSSFASAEGWGALLGAPLGRTGNCEVLAVPHCQGQ